MTQPIAISRLNGRLCGLITATVILSGARYADAQEPAPVTPAAVAPAPAEPHAAASDAPPAAASDLAALQTKVETLTSKLEEMETAALLQSTEDSAPAIEEDKLRIYGFMDFGMDKIFASKDNPGALVKPTSANTFVFGNLNLYVDAMPVEHVRAMAEVRLTLAPHGEEIQYGPPLGTSYERINTTAFDFSSPSAQSQLRLGGLFIERAWSEYEFSNLFKLQAGLFLNPFGIWNLDHGSPTLISLQLPGFIASQMVPTRLLGLHAYGSTFFGNSELGYAVHVTNGRSPLDFDLSEDKALGGRLFLANEGDYGRLVLGVSGYWGTYLDEERAFVPSNGTVILGIKETVAYDEEVLGFDVALDVGALRVRSEAVLHWVHYEDGKVEAAVGSDGLPHFLPNRLEFAGYVLAAYRTPWKLEPYLEAETVANKAGVLPRWAGASGFSTSNLASLTLSVGLNIELTTHTQLKWQLAWARSYDRHFENKQSDFPTLYARLVTSF